MGKVITFHKINDVSWFEKFITLLKSKHKIVSINDLEDYLKEKKNLNGIFHLTFDDGDVNFYNVIYPVIKKLNIPATIFISPSICIEEKNLWFQEVERLNPDRVKRIISDRYKIDIKLLIPIPVLWILKNFKIEEIWGIINTYRKLYNVEEGASQNMTIEQLLEIDKYGLVEIGAHTMNHPILTNEDDETCENEIIGSFTGLENILVKEIKFFAYPNGLPGIDFGEREVNILKDINCEIAFSTDARDINIDDNPLSIPRYCYDQHNFVHLKTKLFIGKYWYKLKYLILREEGATRTKLKSKILSRL